MKSNKLLSIIVPAYNMEAYLPKCLGSLVLPENSLEELLDVIVINDGSTDRTSEIAHEFERRYPGVFRVVDKSNGNYGSCINAALPIATGFYVKILDADDSVDPSSLAKLMSVLAFEKEQNSEASDLIVTDYDCIDATGKTIRHVSYRFPSGRNRTLGDATNGNERFSVHSIVYRISVLREVGFRQTEGISYTDTEWIVDPMSKVRHVRYFPVVVSKYLVERPGQTMEEITFASRFQQLADIGIGMAKRYEFHITDCVPEAKRYYTIQVLRVIQTIYDACLFKLDGRRVSCDIYGFDSRLREAHKMYALSGNIKFASHKFPVRYIAEWRRGGMRGRMSILFLQIYSRLKQLFTRCKCGDVK